MFCSIEAYEQAVDYMNNYHAPEDAVYAPLQETELSKRFKAHVQETRRMIHEKLSATNNIHTDKK